MLKGRPSLKRGDVEDGIMEVYTHEWGDQIREQYFDEGATEIFSNHLLTNNNVSVGNLPPAKTVAIGGLAGYLLGRYDYSSSVVLPGLFPRS